MQEYYLLYALCWKNKRFSKSASVVNAIGVGIEVSDSG
jgi:hypothetical protein